MDGFMVPRKGERSPALYIILSGTAGGGVILADSFGSVADAEEAVQEAFARGLGMSGRRPPPEDPAAWLYRVAANHCWDILRRRKIRQDKETDDLETLPLEHPDPSQLDQLIEKRTSEEVRKALDKLGPRARMALVLRYYSDMSYDEIADSLGVRRAFVGVVLLRARHELRQALEGTGAMAAGGAL
jgi:RNA polymerase sigma-70 factor (ECF subfamily)